MYTYTAPSTNALPVDAQNLYEELLRENHLLIGGVTGSGKSVLLNGLMYQAMQSLPRDVPGGKQFILIDPKMTELSDYKNLPHTLVYADDDKPIYNALEYARSLIETRNRTTAQLREAGIQRTKGYVGSDVYVVIDELLAITLHHNRKLRREMGDIISRIAFIGRSAKVHLLVCTQRPTKDVIDPAVVGNIDSRVGLRTTDGQDSRNIISSFSGCKDLPRYGFAYVHTPSRMKPEKVSVPMVDEEELWNRAQEWARQKREADAESAAVFVRMVAEAEAAEAAKAEAVAETVKPNETAEPEAVEVPAEVPVENAETEEIGETAEGKKPKKRSIFRRISDAFFHYLEEHDEKTLYAIWSSLSCYDPELFSKYADRFLGREMWRTY